MKAVILAGGYGTRLSEETAVIPKPMVEIGGRPILWHIMKIYNAFGVNDFIICCGHKGHLIKKYFTDYWLNNADLTVDLARREITHHRNGSEPWKVTLVDTGDGTMTGGRLKRIRPYLNDETFFLTYGDGLADIDIAASLDHHRNHRSRATVTAVRPPGRFGALAIGEESGQVDSFREKPSGDDSWINGGFYILEPDVIDYIAGDETVWEREPMERLAAEGQLAAYRHYGFWQPMDTLRDKHVLEDHWSSGFAPWRIWEERRPSVKKSVAVPAYSPPSALSLLGVLPVTP